MDGWSSREPTVEDHARRRLIAELLRSDITPERKEELRALLTEVKT